MNTYFVPKSGRQSDLGRDNANRAFGVLYPTHGFFTAYQR